MCTKISPSFIEFKWKTKKFFNDAFNGQVHPLRVGEFGPNKILPQWYNHSGNETKKMPN